MTRKTLMSVSLLLTMLGCSGSESCAAIADDGVAAINDLIASVGDIDFDDMMASPAPEMSPPPDVARRLDELEERVAAADCSEEEMTALMRERADQIEGDGFLAETMRNLFREGPGAFGDLNAP